MTARTSAGYAASVRVLQVVHGFPPRERAGTEVYAGRVADGLAARGHTVLTVAAAPEPGAPMWRRTDRPGLIRLVNNAPYAGLRTGASDAHFDRILERIHADFSPDVLHIQHLCFASTTFQTRTPTVWTLHDAWAWCAAGGLLLHDGSPCAGPSPACVNCASRWVKDSPAQVRTYQLASALGRFVEPAHLQRAWGRLPRHVRALVNGPAAPLAVSDLDRRRGNILAFARRCARIVSPSRWLADAARANGVDVTDVLPHGCDLRPGPRGEGPFVFIGTLAFHKGPDLVRDACAAAGVPLRIYGRPTPGYTVENDGPLDEDGVQAALTQARALVLGSRWPENAPLVVLEARAAGCPVIAPAIGGLPELVEHGVDGWLYPPGDLAALTACIHEAAAAPRTPRPPPSFATHLDGLLAVYRAARQTT